jgi:hypothetical protein
MRPDNGHLVNVGPKVKGCCDDKPDQAVSVPRRSSRRYANVTPYVTLTVILTTSNLVFC